MSKKFKSIMELKAEAGKALGNAKNATFRLRAKEDMQGRRFSIKKGSVWSSMLIDNYIYYDSCIASFYIDAVAVGAKFFSFDGVMLPVESFEALGWSCYNRTFKTKNGKTRTLKGLWK